MTEYQRTEVIERDDPGPRGPWWRENWWIWLALLAVIAVALILWLAFGRPTGGGDRTTMPNVIGLREDEARERIENAGLEPNIVGEQSDAPEGEVISQDPGAGTQLQEGEEVTASVSRGDGTETVTQTETETETETETQTETETETETRTETTEIRTASMPDVTGQPLGEAAAAILDLDLYPQAYPVESQEEAGTIVAQRPDPGTEVEVDITTTIRLNVATGTAERERTEVPDVTGPDAAEALARCYEAGLTCRIVFRDAPEPDNVGEVIDQQPAAGAAIRVLEQVTLAVGR